MKTDLPQQFSAPPPAGNVTQVSGATVSCGSTAYERGGVGNQGMRGHDAASNSCLENDAAIPSVWGDGDAWLCVSIVYLGEGRIVLVWLKEEEELQHHGNGEGTGSQLRVTRQANDKRRRERRRSEAEDMTGRDK
ncbi:hypothetical protein QQ045_025092 [Rhodiola kirilowii]